MKTVNIYGFTVVNSEGYGDGTESKTHLYSTQKMQEKEAYKAYKNAFLSCEFKNKEDENGNRLMSKKEFLKEINDYNPTYTYIQAPDHHIQVELFVQEIALEE